MSRRRFIAGAVCPECGETDRLVVETLHPVEPADPGADDASAGRSSAGRGPGKEYRRCVNCGFIDEKPVAGAGAPRTRLDGGLKRPAEDPATPADPVRIIDPRRG
ncbi:MAG: YheV family putative metal-binding protein [Pseudomonadales bacterium]